MRLTSHTDYALRVLIYLGLNSERYTTIREISDRYKISRNHLMKVVYNLGQHGYISTVRGKHGGMRLARAPQEIILGAVVRHMEPDFRIAACFERGKDSCTIAPACVLKAVLADARDAFFNVLDQHSLADLLGPADELRELICLDAVVS